MDTDIICIYEKLRNRYPILLTGAHKQGLKSAADYPILKGTSELGTFELFYDDVPSFAFYVMRNNGEVVVHFHMDTAEEAEETVANFMEGKLTLI